MMRFPAFTLVIVFIVSLFSFGCQAPKGNADDAFKRSYWSKSIELYKEEIPKTKDKAKASQKTYNVAYAYFRMKDYNEAAKWFEDAEKQHFAEVNPEVLLYLAESRKAICDYEGALVKFNEYKAKMPSDIKGEYGAKSCQMAIEWQKNPTRYKVENMAPLNSVNDDATPVYSSKDKREIIFYSYRDGSTGEEKSAILGQDFPDLYSTSLDKKGQWTAPVLLGKEVNSEFTEGGPAMSADMKTLYFSRCGGKEQEKGCQIYTAKRSGKGFALAVLVPIAGDSLACAHPVLSPDNQVLYFTSNMSGGQGGKDLWYMTFNKKANAFEKPTNLGPEINTPGDEIFPYIHSDGTLYFSSNGHIGIGGFDLFKATKLKDGFGMVTNLKIPLNSCADDISIFFDGKDEKGFISSNRTGGIGKLDVWSFTLPPLEFALKGKITEEGTAKVIPNASVYLTGSDGSKAEALSDKEGMYSFKLLPDVSYEVYVVSNDKYGDEEPLKKGRKKYLSSPIASLTTVGINESKTFEQDFVLPFIPIKLELPNVVYEYNKADLKPESKAVLQKFIKEVLNPNSTITIEMGSHTDFRGSNLYNRKLAQARAESAVKYLIEQGVDPNRLKAKGYGEDAPKKITKDNVKFVPAGYEAIFPIGTVLTEKFINGLKTKELQEVAHQMNRRTEFMFLCTDWVQGKSADACLLKK